MHSALTYSYRDGAGHVRFGRMILEVLCPYLKGPQLLPDVEQLRSKLRAACADGKRFIAHQVGVPEVFLWDPQAGYDDAHPLSFPANLRPGGYVINETDTCWHHLESLELVDVDAAREQIRHYGAIARPMQIQTLVAVFEAASARGWDEFRPADLRMPSAVMSETANACNACASGSAAAQRPRFG